MDSSLGCLPCSGMRGFTRLLTYRNYSVRIEPPVYWLCAVPETKCAGTWVEMAPPWPGLLNRILNFLSSRAEFLSARLSDVRKLLEV